MRACVCVYVFYEINSCNRWKTSNEYVFKDSNRTEYIERFKIRRSIQNSFTSIIKRHFHKNPGSIDRIRYTNCVWPLNWRMERCIYRRSHVIPNRFIICSARMNCHKTHLYESSRHRNNARKRSEQKGRWKRKSTRTPF